MKAYEAPVLDSPTKPGKKKPTDSSGAVRIALPQEKVDQWRDRQFEVWRGWCSRDMKWLVTDFITLGSPLTHIELLLNSKGGSFQSLCEEREYPTKFPSGEKAMFYRCKYTMKSRQLCDALTPHSGALFAVTRWSNAYFPTRGLFGDPMGGDLIQPFEYGIRNQVVRAHPTATKTWIDGFALSQVRYWTPVTPADAARRKEKVKGVALREKVLECNRESNNRFAI